MSNHTQTHITYGDIEADVDEKIADFILWLWLKGIKTKFSCQEGDESKPYIQFDYENCKKFFDLVVSLKCNYKNKSAFKSEVFPWPFIDPDWKFECYPWFDVKNNSTIILTIIHFPFDDIKLIMEKR